MSADDVLHATTQRCQEIEDDARVGEKWAAEENNGTAMLVWRERAATAAEIRRFIERSLGEPS